MKTGQTILSLLLVAMILVTSISHSISFHLCGGSIEDVAFFGHARSCTGLENSCDRDFGQEHHSLNNKGCCKDTKISIDSDKYLSKITEKISIEKFQDISIPVIDLIQNDSDFSGVKNTHCAIYKPPLIERDITVLVQTFLI